MQKQLNSLNTGKSKSEHQVSAIMTSNIILFGNYNRDHITYISACLILCCIITEGVQSTHRQKQDAS